MNKLISTIFRLWASVSKIALLIYIAKYCNPSVNGEIVLYTITSSILVQILGIELHYINCRAMHRHSNEEHAQVLNNQFGFHLFSYLIVVVIFLVYSSIVELRFEYVLFLVIVLIEHLCMEYLRVLQFGSRFGEYSIGLFIKNGVWPILFILAFEAGYGNAPVILALLLWLLSTFISALYLSAETKKLYPKLMLTIKFSPSLIYKSACAATPFITTTLVSSIYTGLDKYVTSYFLGSEMLGIYTLFFSITSSIQIGFNAILGASYGPELLKALTLSQNSVYAYKKKFKFALIVYFAISFVALMIAIPILLSIIDKPEYEGYFICYTLLILFNFVQIISDLSNFELYTRNLDKASLMVNIISVLFAMIFIPAMIYLFGVIGTCIGMLGFVTFQYLNRMRACRYAK